MDEVIATTCGLGIAAVDQRCHALSPARGGEAVGRLVWRQSLTGSCDFVSTSVVAGPSKPNCHQVDKYFETGAIVSDYNDCGYRTAESCLNRDPRQLRAVVLGTSITRGYMVDYDSGFAARTTVALHAACNRPVDLQNVSAVIGNDDHSLLELIEARSPEIISLRPDVIVLTLSTFDVWKRAEASISPSGAGTGAASQPYFWQSWRDKIGHFVRYQSHLFAVVRQLVFHDPNLYLKSALANEDEQAYMEQPLSAAWQRRVDALDAVIAAVAAQAHSVQAALVVMFVPGAPQIRLDPLHAADRQVLALTRIFREKAEKYGATFVDLDPPMRKQADVPGLFFLGDGHPMAAAHAVMADALSTVLLRDVPPFRNCKSVAMPMTTSATNG